MKKNQTYRALKTYSMDHWGAGYFSVNEQGQLEVGYPSMRQRVPLIDILNSGKQHGLGSPLLIRISGILQDRIQQLCQAFAEAMAESRYQANYSAVYPIKVNQQRQVVETLFNTPIESPNCGVGLEAGSKPELMAVLALSRPGSMIVCNGYKDREYIRLALIGEKMQRKVFIVIEKLSELKLVLREMKALGVNPRIGVRVRLSSVGKGQWQNSGGEKAKFGLSACQVIQFIEILKQEQALSSLKLIHFHLGSQISNIADIRKGLQEAARYFAQLKLAGAGLEFVDVGGGLGIDYDGSHSRTFCSMNYSINDYAFSVVQAMQQVCDQHGLQYPNLISESGRALTAHHAILLTDIIDRETTRGMSVPELGHKAPAILHEMLLGQQKIQQSTDPGILAEVYYDLSYCLTEVHEKFTHGILGLADKSHAERLYYTACELLQPRLDAEIGTHREILDEINEKLADKLFLNFSLFQSIPDAWGIDQVFPILPIEGLDRPLDRRAVLQDITCDSDGCVKKYVDWNGVSTTLPMFDFDESNPPPIAIMLVGAYQEILGDMHNLFGDTDSVDVNLKPDGKFELFNLKRGDSVDDILRYVNYDPKDLLQRIHQQLLESQLSHKEQMELLAELKDGLSGYTYLE